MALSNKPVFTQKPITQGGYVTAAKTDYGNLTGAVKIYQGGVDGTLIKAVSARPLATCTVSKLVLFAVSADSLTILVVANALMAAYTHAATTLTPTTSFSEISEATPLRLPAGWSLYAASQVALATGIAFQVQGEDF